MAFILKPLNQFEGIHTDGTVRTTVELEIPLAIAIYAFVTHRRFQHRKLWNPAIGHTNLMHMRIGRPGGHR
jgi:hypothetical protein